MADMTERQLEVLKFINEYREKEQCNPTSAEISAAFGWASPNAAHEHLMGLRRHGAIEDRQSIYGAQRRARGYVVLVPWDEYA